MPLTDSNAKRATDPRQLALAKSLLAVPKPSQENGTVLLAAAFAAASALALATATILAPPVNATHVAKSYR
jgi:hypothetical protein